MGAIFWNIVQEEVEKGSRSCLTCMVFKTRAKAKVVQCEKHPTVIESAEFPSENLAKKCVTKAKNCKDFEEEEF